MRVVGLIQARMGSARLPGKVMLPLAGAPLLQRLIERTSASRRLDALAVATSTEKRDDPIGALCRELKAPCFRGSEEDVLGRMLAAAEWLCADIVVRLTADNPLVSRDLIDFVVDAFIETPQRPDYAHTVEDTGFPFGLCVEVVTMEALRDASQSNDPSDREHVTNYVRCRPDRFPSLAVKAPGRFAVGRVTVDTAADYRRVKCLFESLYDRNPSFGFRDVMDHRLPNDELAELATLSQP